MKNSDRFLFRKELSNCFRRPDDLGKIRRKKTGSEGEIASNLKKLMKDWKSNVPEATLREIDLLMTKHSSCLANIPKGYGTDLKYNSIEKLKKHVPGLNFKFWYS